MFMFEYVLSTCTVDLMNDEWFKYVYAIWFVSIMSIDYMKIIIKHFYLTFTENDAKFQYLHKNVFVDLIYN